jgi:selenocysteine-specific translation elongation factor
MIINKCKLVGSAFLAFGLLGNMAHGSSGADTVNVRDNKGNTALHRLVSIGLRNSFNNTRVIAACIECGVDPSLKNNEGLTALDILVRWIKNNEARDFELNIQAMKVAQMLKTAEKARESALREIEEDLALAQSALKKTREDLALTQSALKETEENLALTQSAQRTERERGEVLERNLRAREEALERAEREREEAEALAERERRDRELAEREREEAVERAERAREEAAELAQRQRERKEQHAGWWERVAEWFGLERAVKWFRFGGEKAGECGGRSPSR